jgi:hypothetical protein
VGWSCDSAAAKGIVDRYLITYTLSVQAKNRLIYAYCAVEGSIPLAAHNFCNEKRKVLDFYEMLVYNLFIIKN